MQLPPSMLLAIALHLALIKVDATKTTFYDRGKGICMIRGQCGKESFFGPELPCPDNGEALEPDPTFRTILQEVCGDRYAEGPVCCAQSQVESLRENLKKAENLIASCPACKNNFFDFFCTFTCSPDQSEFLSIEETAESSNGREIATHLSHYVANDTAQGFFNSCKDVKFSATNGYVMELIGGGAENANAFLRFLGHKSLFGSPIQIDYPGVVPDDVTPFVGTTRQCNDSGPTSRCACIDCPQSCPVLSPATNPRNFCAVGVLPCLSFAILIVYIVGIVAFLSGYLGHLTYNRKLRQSPSRLQLNSRDSNASMEEDDALLNPQVDQGDTYFLNTLLHRAFYRLGYVCASYPYLFIGSSFVAVGILSIGWINFAVETDPVHLWVASNSAAAQEKIFFDETFGPFYRTQQIFLTNASFTGSSVITYENLRWWFQLEEEVRDLVVGNISFSDVCFNPTGEACIIQSVTGYWQSDIENLDKASWQEQLEACANQPGSFECLPLFQQPLKPYMILGGYQEGILSTQALVSSIVVSNSLDPVERKRAATWEEDLKLLLIKSQEQAATRGLRLSFSTEISLQQELNKTTNTDAKIVIISYLAMFLYASLSLGGSVLKGKRALVESKFTLGFFGIFIVLLSISASVGLFSLAGVKVTLIIAEVIPFLVLAVGVDNIFLLVHEFERINARYPEKAVEQRIGSTMAVLGPSILLSASTEVVTFALGIAIGMPAVKNFAIYATGAVFFDAVFQVTMFPAAMAIDQLRVESNRVDCMPLLRIQCPPNSEADFEGYLPRLIRRRYAPYLLRPYIKAVVIFVFISLSALSIGLLPRIELGLDQQVALPRDSYLIEYFQDLEKYFETGPPVYFVAPYAEVTHRPAQQSMCGRFTSCDEYSIVNILEQERKRPEVSYLLEPAASWLDDFFFWLNPQLEKCCRVRRTDEDHFCEPDEPEKACKVCFEGREPGWNITLAGMPEGPEFMRYVEAWLQASTSEDCPIGGKAPYSDAVILSDDRTSLKASHTRSFHQPLRSQSDFINSYAAARRISREITARTGLSVFPYAIHYIFFDQYESIMRLTFYLVGSALLSVFVISSIILGSFVAAGLMTVTVAMIVLNVAGIMAIWGISLNALSLVNLVICVGIGVEFCSHFVKSYMLTTAQSINYVAVPGKSREQRVWGALVAVGSSVITGITLCKFVGVIVLAFTKSKIFEIYYFRMWFSLVFVAASHGLVFLPVIFSIAGPTGYVDENDELFEDNEWANSAGTRYANALFSDYETANTDTDEDVV